MDTMKRHDLNGKIAVVTASTSGIGFAIARRLAQEGATVIISSRKQENVDAAFTKLKSEELKVIGLVCDVTNPEHRQKLLDQANTLGGLDILVSTAGTNPRGSIIDCSASLWDEIFDTNVKSGFLLTQESIPLFKKRGGGNIVFLASIAGYHGISDLTSLPHNINPLSVYCISKTTLIALTKAAALDLAGLNIRVNCVSPTFVHTPFSSFLTSHEIIGKAMLNQIPMRRFGEPEDVSGVIAFLVSKDASFITGESIVIGGGQSTRL